MAITPQNTVKCDKCDCDILCENGFHIADGAEKSKICKICKICYNALPPKEQASYNSIPNSDLFKIL